MDQEWDLSIRMMERYSLGPLGDIALTLLASMWLGHGNWYVQNVSTFSNTFAVVSPLICVFWIQLTRTDAIFSRIALVSRFCAKIQLSVKIQENIAKFLFHQKTHGARMRDEDGLEAWLTTRGVAQAWPRPPVVRSPELPSRAALPPTYTLWPETIRGLISHKYRGSCVAF
jgi:hypothetical protein